MGSSADEGGAPAPPSRATGIGRLIELRYAEAGDALIVRPALLVAVFGAVGVVIGSAVAVAGVWGRTGTPQVAAFGALYLLVGAWFVFLAARPWVTIEPEGVRVGSVRAVWVPWSELRALTMRDVSRWGFAPVFIRVERRGKRSLWLQPPFSLRTYRSASELRYVAKRIAVEAERHGAGPIPWPEHLVHVDGDGNRSVVR